MAFYSKKSRKLWIWIAIERATQEVLGFSLGSRGKKAFKSVVNQISKYKTQFYATDAWKIYGYLPASEHLIGKKHTTQIESLNANVRHYLARFRRKTRCYSKSPLMVELSLNLLFFKEYLITSYTSSRSLHF